MRRREYRCFRCKVEFIEGEPIEAETPEELSDIVILRSDDSDDIVMHQCNDGGLGIADFIGLTPEIATIYLDKEIVTSGYIRLPEKR